MPEGPQDLIGQLRAAGAEHVQEQAAETVSLDVLRSWCEREERVLRYQYEGRRFPDRYEAELASLAPSSMSNALRRWALIKHLYRVRFEQLEARQAKPDKEAIAHLIMSREPVAVRILGRVIKVTSRSYAAMAEIAAEASALEQLDADLQLVARMQAKVLGERRATPLLEFGRHNALRRRARWLHALAIRIATESRWHRMALYAHALTPSGAPAHDVLREAPEWWEEVGPGEDGMLLAALWEAGPGRYHAMGAAPLPRVSGKGSKRSENFGWAGLFAAWEPKLSIDGAPLQDVDLPQLLLKVRAQAVEGPELG